MNPTETALISAITGHSPKSVDEIIRRYLVRTRAQAAIAFDRRLAAERGGRLADAGAATVEK